jgi:hypothetical protein
LRIFETRRRAVADTKFEHAKRSRNPLAAIELLDAMEWWSEEAFCAGWLIGLASRVEDAIAGTTQVGPDFKDTLAVFRRTRAACGGTWIFDADAPGWRRFVTDDEWDAMNRIEPNDGFRKRHGGEHG